MKIKKGLSIFAISLIVVLFTSTFVFSYDFNYDSYDFEGKTVTFVNWGDAWPTDDPDFQEQISVTENKFNCKIKLKSLSWGNYVEQLMQRVLSGDSKYDIWEMHSAFFHQLVSKDALYPVGELISDKFFQDEFAKPDYNFFGYQGKKYSVSDPLPNPGWFAYIIWNKDLFERQNLPNLYDIYQSGEWTWKKCEEVAKAATKDKDSDGNIDQWGIGAFHQQPSVFAMTNGVMPTVKKDGKVVCNMEDPAYLEALSTIYEWTMVDNIARGWSDSTDFFNGELAMHIVGAGILWKAPGYKEKMKDEFGIVPLPKGPNAEKISYPMVAARAHVIPSNAENAEGLFALHYFFRKKAVDDGLSEQDKLMEQIADAVYDEESYQVLMEAYQNWDGTYHPFLSITDAPDLRSNMERAIKNGEPPAAVMAERKPIVQSRLDELLNQ